MRIAIVTDAWAPQVNGVVRTLETTALELTAMGHEAGFVTPADFGSVPCPTYPEIRLALAHRHQVGERIKEFAPDSLHIATEGPLGFAARSAFTRHPKIANLSHVATRGRSTRIVHLQTR